ncbi:peptidase T [Providencia stuartii]|uniref:Peptidase T n=1 Tax=Providencia stuartii (strain MRSN 2154) TaxID=1157951 RepID=A0A140NPW5_PROSM|nr:MULTISPECIES: peptidase T [Providencia]AFH95529.1 peptidase T [Providencia stuartii MRSN 2154]MDE8745170.1 peptidase T [Providencia thailandensis]MDE8764599.1 peptidase T [Providencia thailandensis]MDE8777102.1 peptidase T [Providencia thailandensis]MDE8781091.1 peptidase T [Providencia thailandensis]
MNKLGKQLEQRFFRYLAIESQSDAAATVVPSTEGQRDLAKLLAKELESYGLKEIYIDEHAILYAVRPGNKPSAPKIGFVTHLDTVDVGLSPVIKPQTLKYEGKDLCLNAQEDIWFKASEHPEAAPYIGEEIIFSDGTSVLGADNKAAVTVVMELMDKLQQADFDCGDIYIAFVPDEEIGLRGSKIMDLSRFKVDFAYTIDCCDLGEVVYETFNAASIEVTIKGVTAHPMSAKNVLLNPIRVAHDFIGCFDRFDTPEHTEQREGYFYVTDLIANPDNAKIKMAIRDFDRNSYEARKRYIGEAIELIRTRHPRAKIDFKIEDVYSNISDSLGDDRTAIDLIFEALKIQNVEPKVIPMRGGTDGSALSARGILTPNYFTGALNFHSRFEFLPLSSFEKSYLVSESICRLVGQK